MDIHSEVHSWLRAMEGTCCLSRPMCENQLEKRLAKQLLFVCLSELASKRSRWKRSRRPLLAPSVISLQPTSEAIGGSSGLIAGAVDSDGLERRSRPLSSLRQTGRSEPAPWEKGTAWSHSNAYHAA